jgi:ubiquinone/menaquinone biosynthesis C-methylase UbiE
MKTQRRDAYIPAFHFALLTPLFDPVMGLLMRESAFKARLVEQAHIQNGQRILDLGCGTATLTILLKQRVSEAEVIGLDGDSRVLDIARRKIDKARLAIRLDQGMAFALPYPDAAFDRVVSSLMFHHLTSENKRRTTKEVYRIMRPGGELHVADFGRPHRPLMALIAAFTHRLEQVGDNMKGLLPGVVRDAGFQSVEETVHYSTPIGTLTLYRASKPA